MRWWAWGALPIILGHILAEWGCGTINMHHFTLTRKCVFGKKTEIHSTLSSPKGLPGNKKCCNYTIIDATLATYYFVLRSH